MNLTPEQIKSNWDEVISIIKSTFDGERKEKLLEMYEYFQDRMMFAPASGNINYHNCFPGGYVAHVLNIVNFSKEIKALWETNNATINFTDEELIFAALHHDLGKVGDLEYDYYIPNPSEWHRNNRGDIYAYQFDKMHYMTVTDRSFWLLQHFGIKVTDKEYLGILLADGLYNDGNETYLRSYDTRKKMKTNLPYIIHQADMMAARIEFELSGDTNEVKQPKLVSQKKSFTQVVKERSLENNMGDRRELFDELFGDKK